MHTVETPGYTTHQLSNDDCTSTIYLTIPVNGYKLVMLKRNEVDGVNTYVEYVELGRYQLDHMSNILNKTVIDDGFITKLYYMPDPLDFLEDQDYLQVDTVSNDPTHYHHSTVVRILNRIKSMEY